jgi:hypothetical protein
MVIGRQFRTKPQRLIPLGLRHGDKRGSADRDPDHPRIFCF